MPSRSGSMLTTTVWRRARGRILFSALVAAGAAACTSFSGSTDEPAKSDTDAGDAGVTDTGVTDTGVTAADVTDTGAVDANDAAIVNLLANGDFEFGCANWSAPGSSAAASTIAHSGMGSCLVCNALDGASFVVFQDVTTTIVPGTEYRGSVWLRKAPDAGVTGTGLSVDVIAADLSPAQVGFRTTGPALSDTWQQVTALIDVTTDAGARVRLSISGAAGPACLLLDDALLYRQP